MKEHNIIHTINLEDRPERLEGFLNESDLHGFGVKIWNGILIKHNNKKAINLAHKQIVQYAKDNYLPKVFIAEDDCRMMAIGAWRYYVDNMPDDFDIYFSMYYTADSIEGNRITGLFSGMTLYCVHQRFYDTFLSLNDDCHIDREMLGPVAKDHKFIFCDKVTAEQDGSKSSNTFTTCNYRPFLKGRKIFGDVKIE